MFEKKKLWMALAAATLVAACGGGSDNPSPSTGGNGGGGGTPANDTTLAGSYLELDPSNLMIVNQPLPISAYESDAADGGLWGQSKGTDADGNNNGAPFETFGLRLNDAAQVAEGETLAEGSGTGRLAISLSEMAESVQAAEVAENMQIMVTGITVTTDATGNITVTQADDATMYVSGTAANGDIVDNVAVALPAGAITLAPGAGTAGSADMIFNVDAAFDAATAEQATELAKLADLSGRFDMNFAFSAADVYRVGTEGSTQLADQTIAVEGNDLEAVEGSGIAGNIWIDYTHPNQ